MVARSKFALPVSVSPFVLFTIFGVLEFLFDRFVWKLLCYISFFGVKDFSGEYKGTMTSRDNEGNAKDHEAKFVIKQSWNKIVIYFVSEQAHSKSFSASVLAKGLVENEFQLWYNYRTEGRYIGDRGNDKVESHYGTTKLNLSGENLTGVYFTEQSRDSSGTFTMRKSDGS